MQIRHRLRCSIPEDFVFSIFSKEDVSSDTKSTVRISKIMLKFIRQFVFRLLFTFLSNTAHPLHERQWGFVSYGHSQRQLQDGWRQRPTSESGGPPQIGTSSLPELIITTSTESSPGQSAAGGSSSCGLPVSAGGSSCCSNTTFSSVGGFSPPSEGGSWGASSRWLRLWWWRRWWRLPEWGPCFVGAKSEPASFASSTTTSSFSPASTTGPSSVSVSGSLAGAGAACPLAAWAELINCI